MGPGQSELVGGIQPGCPQHVPSDCILLPSAVPLSQPGHPIHSCSSLVICMQHLAGSLPWCSAMLIRDSDRDGQQLFVIHNAVRGTKHHNKPFFHNLKPAASELPGFHTSMDEREQFLRALQSSTWNPNLDVRYLCHFKSYRMKFKGEKCQLQYRLLDSSRILKNKTTTSFYFSSMLSVVHFLKYNLSWSDMPLLLLILFKEWEIIKKKKTKTQLYRFSSHLLWGFRGGNLFCWVQKFKYKQKSFVPVSLYSIRR